MGRTPCCEKTGLNKGKWTAEEDEKLINYIKSNGDGSWRSLPKNAGLLRCGKSCRLRWINYLREDVKRGNFSAEEEETIVKLQKTLGNKWSLIASHLPAGRTDNEIKNYWNSHLSRRLYRFRSIDESTMAKEDMIKMLSTSKRRVGRVNREVPKKYNKNATTSQNVASRTRKPKISSTSAVPRVENAKETDSHYLNGVNAGSDEMKRENDLNPLNPLERNKDRSSASMNCSYLSSEFFCKEGWPNAFILSPNKGSETEELELWKEIDEDILMNLNHFVEGRVADKSEDSNINDGKDKGNGNIIQKEFEGWNLNSENGNLIQKEFEGWNLSSENGNLHTCSSPIVSCYNEEQLYWDVNYDGKEFNLWNEEEEDLIMWT